jgi:hypothetical protein
MKEELDAKLLMIGDWICAIDRDGIKHPCKVATIEYDSTNDRDDYTIDFTGTGFEPEWPNVTFECEPILLTEGILKKNGFDNDFYEEETVADYTNMRFEGYSLKCESSELDDALITWCNSHLVVTTDFHGCVQKDIEYVHELQHAIKMCGINKEIVL